jgi:hypothetical protein
MRRREAKRLRKRHQLNEVKGGQYEAGKTPSAEIQVVIFVVHERMR